MAKFEKVVRPTALVLPPVLAAGLCIVRDDRKQDFDQPHDHRDTAPTEAPQRFVTIDSGSSTATVTTFSHQFFNLWSRGEEFWSVKDRPALIIGVKNK